MSLQSFDAWIEPNSKVLILGTMPGNESLQQSKYYAHPRNAFWPLLFTIFQVEFTDDYEVRKQFLNDHHIGLWDVLKSCERKGSLDSNIKNEIPNDFSWLLNPECTIHHIFFNGTKAYQLFKKHIGFYQMTIEYTILPSTSPANAISFEDKLKHWMVIKDSIGKV